MWHLYNQYLEPYVWVNGVFTTDEVKKIAQNTEPLQPGLICNNEIDESTRRSDISWIQINDDNNWIYQKIQEAINWANTRYYNFDLTWIEHLQLTSYSAEQRGCYAQHLDVSTSAKTQFQTGLRKLSVTVQLTNEEEYQGGDLKIYDGSDGQIVPRQQGTVIVFPSFMLHEVTPVTQGIRKSLVAWAHGPRFR